MISSARAAVRLAVPGDEEAVVGLAVALWPHEKRGPMRRHLRGVLTGKPASTLPLVIFVAEEAARVIGFIEVGLRSHADGCDGRRPVGFLEGWYVIPARRRHGVGRALVAAAERWSRAQGCAEMASDTWAANKLGLRAHEALGYEVADRCVNFRKTLRARRR